MALHIKVAFVKIKSTLLGIKTSVLNRFNLKKSALWVTER